MLLSAMAAVTACATTAQRQAQQANTAIRAAAADFKACGMPIINKPAYASLLRHTSDVNTGQPTMTQLTDETVPSAEEAHLWTDRHDELITCRQQLLSAVSKSRPDVVPIFVDQITRSDAITVLLVERKIAWGEAARREQATQGDLKEKLAAADRQWNADINAASEAEMARRQAATGALLQWSAQQQLINQMNQPVRTTCSSAGNFVNCTSQ